MICRGIQNRKSFIRKGLIPPLTIKESLEVYYSLKRSDKSMDRENRWKYLNERYIFYNFSSSAYFLNKGNGILKIVEYFEEKIKKAKDAKNSALMKKWNDKLNVFLKMPYHDYFYTLHVGKFRAFEFPSPDGRSIEVLCLNCTDIKCQGCCQIKVPFYDREQSSNNDQREMTNNHKNKGKRFQTPGERVYYNTVGYFKSQKELTKSFSQVADAMGFLRNATLSEVIKYDLGQLVPIAKKEHRCKICQLSFKIPLDLTKHQNKCLESPPSNQTSNLAPNPAEMDDHSIKNEKNDGLPKETLAHSPDECILPD